MTELGAYLGEFAAPPVLLRPLPSGVTALLRSSLAASTDAQMWELDRAWSSSAEFFSAASCVRIAEIGGGPRTTVPYVNGECKNWNGDRVGPSCTWAQWLVQGCEPRLILDALFQYPRYVWAQRKMAELVEARPSDPLRLPEWLMEAHALESVLVYSTNIRFDDDGAYDARYQSFGGDAAGYAKVLRDSGLLWTAPGEGGPPERNAVVQGGIGTRFWNNMSVRRGMDFDDTKARRVPQSREDFAPALSQSDLDHLRAWAVASIGRGAYIPTGQVRVRDMGDRGRIESPVYDVGIDAMVYRADQMLRHYVGVSFIAWQQAAVDYYLLSVSALLPPPDGTIELERLRSDLRTALVQIRSYPEHSLRQAAADMADNYVSASALYMGLLVALINVINSTAGVVAGFVTMALEWVVRGFVDAAGAATGRTLVCPAPPYLRVFKQGCDLGGEAEIRRVLEEEIRKGNFVELARNIVRNNLPLSTRSKLRAALAPPAGLTKSGGGGLVFGAAALLLLSRFLR